MVRRRALAAAFAVGLSLLAGCGAAADGAATGGASSAAGKASVPGELGFTAKTVSGDTFAGASLVGKDAVLWFWAPWCMVCRAEAPGVSRVQEKYGERVAFVGVAGRGEVSAMRDFIADGGVGEFPHVVDEDGSLWASFGISSQPAHAFIDDGGSVTVVRGPLSQRELAERVAELAGS